MAQKVTTILPELKLNYQQLYEMLTYRRPAGSETEKQFIRTYIDVLPGIKIDDFGNRILRIGDSKTLFSAHTDTVHKLGGKQKILVDTTVNTIFKDDGEPLGADDATGVFILLRLIEAGIPGLYVFHRCEEIGGKGSTFIHRKTPLLLVGIDRAVAFDRRDGTDIITHQFGSRCCSDNFALELALQLGGSYVPDDSGIFTDTANYAPVIPECTNVSVGYRNEHTSYEEQDLNILDALIPAALAVDWENLPTERDPKEVDYSGYDYMGASESYTVSNPYTKRKPQDGNYSPQSKVGANSSYYNKYGKSTYKAACWSDDRMEDEVTSIVVNGIPGGYEQAYNIAWQTPEFAAMLILKAFDYERTQVDHDNSLPTSTSTSTDMTVYEDQDIERAY